MELYGLPIKFCWSPMYIYGTTVTSYGGPMSLYGIRISFDGRLRWNPMDLYGSAIEDYRILMTPMNAYENSLRSLWEATYWP